MTDGSTSPAKSDASASRARGTAPRRNPYVVTLTVIWSTALVFALLLLASTTSQNSGPLVEGRDARGEVAAVLFIVAAVVALTHIAVNAVLWRRDE